MPNNNYDVSLSIVVHAMAEKNKKVGTIYEH